MARKRTAGVGRVELLKRTDEAIQYLMEEYGVVDLPKADFATVMAARYGNVWLLGDGKGNARLVSDVCNVTRDQRDHPDAAAVCGGFVIDYAPSIGGMVLLDPTGDLPLNGLVHMLSGDMQRQQAAKTTNRRRVEIWRTAGDQALAKGRADIARVAFQIEREIDAHGVASDSLVEEFFAFAQALLSGDGA